MTGSPQMVGSQSRRSPTPDRTLLERTAVGDESAFAELYDRHYLSLYALAYKIVMDATEADAVVNEVFDHVKVKAQQLDDFPGSAHAWLAEVARNRARGALRAREWPTRSPLAGSPNV